jgi:hypothetical protein
MPVLAFKDSNKSKRNKGSLMAYTDAEDRHFPRRANADGTKDSICPRCFMTVAIATVEADLDLMEALHICDPERLRPFRRDEDQSSDQESYNYRREYRVR